MTEGGEISEKVQALSETQIVLAFQRALVAVYPILLELDCVENDTSLYDPFDAVADALWKELVIGSLQWKYGLNSPPKLSAYGFVKVGPGEDGCIRVHLSDGSTLRFVSFIGDRVFGAELFNAVKVESSDGVASYVSLATVEKYVWNRQSYGALPNPTFQRTATPPLN